MPRPGGEVAREEVCEGVGLLLRALEVTHAGKHDSRGPTERNKSTVGREDF